MTAQKERGIAGRASSSASIPLRPIRADVATLRHSRSGTTNGSVPVNIWRQFDLHESGLKSSRGYERKRLTEAPSSAAFDPSSHHRAAYTSRDSRKIYIANIDRQYWTLIHAGNIVQRLSIYILISPNNNAKSHSLGSVNWRCSQ